MIVVVSTVWAFGRGAPWLRWTGCGWGGASADFDEGLLWLVLLPRQTNILCHPPPACKDALVSLCLVCVQLRRFVISFFPSTDLPAGNPCIQQIQLATSLIAELSAHSPLRVYEPCLPSQWTKLRSSKSWVESM